ncbi:phage terminase small subunit [Yersinia pekkanenii]|uniref:Phage terminase small subunit n=1 Tax=Yersinia pekkanenii TaxID=1288385 RepID=A0A0T9R5D8_9GAMM|nr:phage terminase small subunit [Yersinia pekkanenii]CRY68842.1 phage terminase small subunit [Yersinia pekkanenii]
MTLTEEQKALFDALTQLQRRFVTALLEGARHTEGLAVKLEAMVSVPKPTS